MTRRFSNDSVQYWGAPPPPPEAAASASRATTGGAANDRYTPGGGASYDGGGVRTAQACPDAIAALVVHFKETYGGYHGYSALAVCAVGVALNAANVLVLTQRKMRSPVNALLTLLAVVQLLLLAVYAPFDMLVHVAPEPGLPPFVSASYAREAYILFYFNASVTLQMISSWTTIATAAFRYASVQFSLRSAAWCSYRRAGVAGAAVVIACGLCSVPNALRYRVVVDGRGGTREQPWYAIGNSAPYEPPDSPAMQLTYWLYAIVGKVLPSALLLALTALLVNLLRRTLSRRQALRRQSQCSRSLASGGGAATPSSNGGGGRSWSVGGGGGDCGGGGGASSECSVRDHARTTRMLLAVVVLFLAVELPHGCLVIASAIDRCHHEAYNMLGDLIDLATLVAFSVNFALYCTMSKRFRELFAGLLSSSLAGPRARLRRLRCCVEDVLSRGGRARAAAGAGRRDVAVDGGRSAAPKSIPLFRSSSARRKGGGDGGGRCRGAYAPPIEAADAWSGKSSLDSFHLEVEPQHTSFSQLLCSSSSGSEDSLAVAGRT